MARSSNHVLIIHCLLRVVLGGCCMCACSICTPCGQGLVCVVIALLALQAKNSRVELGVCARLHSMCTMQVGNITADLLGASSQSFAGLRLGAALYSCTRWHMITCDQLLLCIVAPMCSQDMNNGERRELLSLTLRPCCCMCCNSTMLEHLLVVRCVRAVGACAVHISSCSRLCCDHLHVVVLLSVL
jgi:hypothetical protein